VVHTVYRGGGKLKQTAITVHDGIQRRFKGDKMRRWNWVAVLMVVLLSLPAIASAQDDDEDGWEYKTWRMRRSHAGFNGFGGFFYGTQTFKSTMLDNLASSMEISKLESRMGGMGGWGMGHLGNGWRIGGLGFGYDVSAKGVYTDQNNGETYNRRIDVNVGGGGFMVEYSPWMIGPVNFGAGTLLGFGGVQVDLNQNKGAFSWQDITSQYIGSPSAGENITSTIVGGFMFAEPYVTARVHILDWLGFSATAGYHFNSFKSSQWYYSEKELNNNGPDFDMNDLFFRFGFVFGG
jgi:hypothetical protein